jgi:hypothetical protein
MSTDKPFSGKPQVKRSNRWPYTHRMRSQRSGTEDLFTKRVTVDGVTQRVPSKRAERGGLRWRARFVDDEGREVTKAFGRKVDAQAWIDEQTAARITGTYVDPRSARSRSRATTKSGQAIRFGCQERDERWTSLPTLSPSAMSRSVT